MFHAKNQMFLFYFNYLEIYKSLSFKIQIQHIFNLKKFQIFALFSLNNQLLTLSL